MRSFVTSLPARQRQNRHIGLLLCLAFAALAFVARLAAADDQNESRLQQQLAAGEFAPALAVAQQQALPGDRDAVLAQVAAAQARAGAAEAALATAAQMQSDLARGEALRQAAEQPLRFGGLGGGPQPDFDALMDLITSTVAPTTWDDVGGPGSIAPYAGGVWVDARGLLHRVVEENLGQLDAVRDAAPAAVGSSARRTSPLRKVSLPRLERAVQLRQAAGQRLTEEMRTLAGLQRVQYVLVYPETGDVVLAGPAGDWREDREGRLVGVESGQPVLQLDDLVVILRHMTSQSNAMFGCSIKPRQEALAATKAFLEASAKSPLKPGAREAWLSRLRDTLGVQDIEYYGIDPRSRVAQVLVEADYRMKLVGIGLEEGTLGVPSYLSMIQVEKDQPPPPLGVLRWWFTLNYQSLVTNAGRNAYELRGQGVQVLSENELLKATGERVHTGESEPLNREFARNFTQHFGALSQKYPVYAELRNIFDLALACALIKAEDLPQQVGWHLTCFGDAEQYAPAQAFAPEEVESVINHRLVHRTRILATVSGGVHFDAAELVKSGAIERDTSGVLDSRRAGGAPENLPRDRWWWD